MKTILLTGASKGIGFETAKQCAQLGHTVFAIARSSAGLSQLVEQTVNGKIIPIEMDITNPKDYPVLEQTLAHTTQLHGLINNAGLLINNSFFDSTLDDWRNQFEVNVFGVIRLIQSLKLKLGEGSHIVNIGSMGGFQGSDKFPGLSGYSASKGALAILSECLNVELANLGISVNCLALGAVQTDMLAQAFPGYKAPTNAETMAQFISNFVLNGHSLISGKIIPVALNNPG